MSVSKEVFGYLEGQIVDKYTLTNAKGLSASIITFGARLTEMHVPDRNGQNADIVLGFDKIEDYVATDHYFGATCGRYGNRIKAGRFKLSEKEYTLSANEGPNHIHGGIKGFDKYIWTAHRDENETSVTFTHFSHAGEEGYPGEMLVKAKYHLTDENKLKITMSGTSDVSTVLNMVHHSYWNVAGQDSGDITRQLLKIDSDFYTPVDSQLLATGEILSVMDTPFDFRNEKPIGKDIGSVPVVTVGHLVGGGYDHNWVLRDFSPGLRSVAKMVDPESGRGFTLRSTEPGVQIYTAGYLTDKVIAKKQKPSCRYAGITFETQKFPGSPNFSHFNSTRLDPSEVYNHEMEFSFFTR